MALPRCFFFLLTLVALTYGVPLSIKNKETFAANEGCDNFCHFETTGPCQHAEAGNDICFEKELENDVYVCGAGLLDCGVVPTRALPDWYSTTEIPDGCSKGCHAGTSGHCQYANDPNGICYEKVEIIEGMGKICVGDLLDCGEQPTLPYPSPQPQTYFAQSEIGESSVDFKATAASETAASETAAPASDPDTSLSLASNATSPEIERCLHVTQFDFILKNLFAEDDLLRTSRDWGINCLLLHGMDNLGQINNVDQNEALASFVWKAKVQFGMTVGAVGLNADVFKKLIVPYCVSRVNINEKFDMFDLSFEFWDERKYQDGGFYCEQYLRSGAYDCTVQGAFSYALNELKNLKVLAKATGEHIKVETFVPSPTEDQARALAQTGLNTLRINTFSTEPSFNVTQPSLIRLGRSVGREGGLDVSIVFSADAMGPWLHSHSMDEAEKFFDAQFNRAVGKWKNGVNKVGFTYYDYRSLEENGVHNTVPV